MGSSFTEFRGKGFWSHDRLLEAWLRVLSLQLGEDADEPGWQHDLRDKWLLVSAGGMVGCIAPCLDEFITDEERVSVILRTSLATIQSLRAFGEYVPAKFLNALGFSQKYTSDLPIQWFDRIAERFSMLLRGELETDASTSPVLPATWHNQPWDELEPPREDVSLRTAEKVNWLWQRHRMAPFPPDCRGRVMNGIDLALLDSSVASCASCFVREAGKLDLAHTALLAACYRDVAVVLTGLAGEEFAYFRRLERLTGRILEMTLRDDLRFSVTRFDASQIQWRVPWWPVSPEHEAGTAAELRREMCAGHVLFGKTVQAVGCRQDRDDVLFYLGESGPQFAVVHLTYALETRPEWPRTKLFDTVEAWVQQCMIPDAEDFNA